MLETNLFSYIYLIIALLLAISIHEFSHAFIAFILGDPTAKIQGRVTLNPVKHLDPIGAIMIFITFFTGFGIGWGKPVPVNPYNFKNHRIGEALTAIAGPISNFTMAFISSLFVRYLGTYLPTFVYDFLTIFTFLNIGLMCFNLIPIPPLDGSKVLFMFIPDKYYHYRPLLEQRGPIILLGLIIIGQLFGLPIISFILNPLFKLTFWILGL